MTQFETVLERINATKQRMETDITSRTASLFAGMDNKMLKAAKAFSTAAKSIQESRDLNPQGRERRLEEEKARLFEPTRQEYLDALQRARDLVAEGIAEVEAAALPQSDTGAERAPNIALWQFEVSQAKPDDWKALYEEHADDKDYIKLMEIAAKNNRNSASQLISAQGQTMNAAKSVRLDQLNSLFASLGVSAYAYNLSDYIHGGASVTGGSSDFKLSLWTDLENFNTAQIPVSTEGI